MKYSLHYFLVAGLTAALFSGCSTGLKPVSSKTAGKSAGQTVATGATVPAVASAKNSPEQAQTQQTSPIKGSNGATAESLARFAAGVSYELSEQDQEAIAQFEKSALADPGNEPLVIELAGLYFDKKEYQKAVALLSKSARRPDASALLLAWYGRALLETGKNSAAAEMGYAAIKKSPTTLEGYQFLAEVYSRGKQPREVQKVLNRAAKQVKSDALNSIRLAELYLVLAREDAQVEPQAQAQAIKLLTQTAASNPASPVLQRRLADAWHKAGESKRAADIYLKLLDAYSESPVARDSLREQLANIYLQSNDKKAASKQLEAIVHDSPTRYPEAWYFLGALAATDKNYLDAIRNFEKAILLDPVMEKAYYELAMAQADLGQTNNAKKTLERAQEKFRNTFVNEFFSGLVNTRMKDYTAAVKNFTAAEVVARAKEPKRLNQQFWFQFGAACERNQNYKDAEHCFEKCLELSPNFAEALNYLGYMWAERGENLRKARTMIEKALKLEPKNAAYLDSMGWVMFKLQQPEQALKHLLKAVDLMTEPDPTVFDHLGDVYMALRQPEKAREAWKKSLSIEPNQQIKDKLSRLAGAS